MHRIITFIFGLIVAAAKAIVNKGPSITAAGASYAEVENLRKKLLESFSEIDELKSMVERLSMENNKLKSRIEPDPAFDFDVPL